MNLKRITNNDVNNKNYTLNPQIIIEGKNLLIELRKNKHFSPSVFVMFLRKQFYIEVGLFFYPGILHEDELFYINIILVVKRTTFITKIYYYYRLHGNSIILKKNIKNIYMDIWFLIVEWYIN